MIETIGVCDLKNHVSRVLRSVREDMAEYVITLNGEPIAILRPLNIEDLHNLEQDKIFVAVQEMKTLAGEIAAAWISPHSGVEQIVEQRR